MAESEETPADPKDEGKTSSEGSAPARPARRGRRSSKNGRRDPAKKRKWVGALGNKAAEKTLEQAAAAVDLSVEQLVNLVVDSGAVALPPTDNVTELVSLEDLGSRLRSEMQRIPKPDRPSWFRNLVEVQRGAVVVSLRNDQASTHAISEAFDIPPSDIQAVYNDYCDKVGQNVTNVRLSTIVGQMQLVAERVQSGAADKKDWATVWRTQKDLLAAMQSLGIVDKAAQRLEVMHTADDQIKAAIDRAVRLDRMKSTREAEIVRIQDAAVEDVPEEFGESE